MTKLSSKVLNASDDDAMFYLTSASTGSHTLTVTQSDTVSGSPYLKCEFYSGVAATPIPDGAASSTGSAATQTGTAVTTQNNDWVVGFFDNEVNTMTAGANTFIRTGGNLVFCICDTNAAQTPAGSHSLTTSWTGSGLFQNFVMGIVPTAAATAASPLLQTILFQ